MSVLHLSCVNLSSGLNFASNVHFSFCVYAVSFHFTKFGIAHFHLKLMLLSPITGDRLLTDF